MRKSFIETDPHLSEEWDQNKNSVSPLQVSRGSHTLRWWLCPKNHSYSASPGHRTSMRSGCPYCSGKKTLIGYNDIGTTHPHLIDEWDEDNEIGPYDLVAGSNKRIKWRCRLNHTWDAYLYHRTKNGSTCPVCSNKRVLVGFNSLVDTNPELIGEWDTQKNTIKPSEVTAGSGKRVWWTCPKNHSYLARIYTRAGSSRSQCLLCTGNRDPWIVREIGKKFIDSKVNYKLDEIRWDNGVRFEVDILADASWVIEFDGNEYHRRTRDQERDIRKTTRLIEEGFSVIRIRQTPLPDLPLDMDGLYQVRYRYSKTEESLSRLHNKLERIMHGKEETNTPN